MENISEKDKALVDEAVYQIEEILLVVGEALSIKTMIGLKKKRPELFSHDSKPIVEV